MKEGDNLLEPVGGWLRVLRCSQIAPCRFPGGCPSTRLGRCRRCTRCSCLSSLQSLQILFPILLCIFCDVFPWAELDSAVGWVYPLLIICRNQLLSGVESGKVLQLRIGLKGWAGFSWVRRGGAWWASRRRWRHSLASRNGDGLGVACHMQRVSPAVETVCRTELCFSRCESVNLRQSGLLRPSGRCRWLRSRRIWRWYGPSALRSRGICLSSPRLFGAKRRGLPRWKLELPCWPHINVSRRWRGGCGSSPAWRWWWRRSPQVHTHISGCAGDWTCLRVESLLPELIATCLGRSGLSCWPPPTRCEWSPRGWWAAIEWTFENGTFANHVRFCSSGFPFLNRCSCQSVPCPSSSSVRTNSGLIRVQWPVSLVDRTMKCLSLVCPL